MSVNNISIGKLYGVMVGGKMRTIRIDDARPAGGWSGTLQHNNKSIRIRNISQLHSAPPQESDLEAAPEIEPPKAKKSRAKKSKKKSKPLGPDGKPYVNAPGEFDGKVEPLTRTEFDQLEAGAKKQERRQRNGSKDVRPPSALDACFEVLTDNGGPMTIKEMVEAIAEKGTWKPRGNNTPHLFSFLRTDVAKHEKAGTQTRFLKCGRGTWGLVDRDEDAAAAAQAAADAPKPKKERKARVKKADAEVVPAAKKGRKTKKRKLVVGEEKSQEIADAQNRVKAKRKAKKSQRKAKAAAAAE
jgi:hypothetical protein